MQPVTPIQPGTSSRQATLFDEVATAANGTDSVALGALRQRIGFDTLDDKGRLALIQAMRSKVKSANAENQSRTSALRALDAAFPAPYKALKECAQRKAQAQALMAIARVAKLPELPMEFLSGTQGTEEIASDESAALPDNWVRLRAHNGVIDVPRDTFGEGSYFDALINGQMQGGRDAAGAYMVNVDIDALRAIVHFASHSELPALSAEQRVALRTQANAFCMTELISSLDAPLDLRTPRERFSAAEQRALETIRQEAANGKDDRVTAFAVRAFRVMSLRLRAFVLEPDKNPEREVAVDISDMMLGRLQQDVDHIFYGAWVGNRRVGYDRVSFLSSGDLCDEALRNAAMTCESMLNELGYLVKDCRGCANYNSITFSLLN